MNNQKYDIAEKFVDISALKKKLKKTEKELYNTKDFFENILNSIADPVFVKDENHVFLHVNEAFCDFIGLSRQTLIGKTDFDFFPQDEASDFQKTDIEVLSTGKELTSIGTFTDADEQRHIISTRKRVFRHPDNNELILVGISRNITKLEEIKSNLAAQKDELESIVQNRTLELKRINEELEQEIEERQQAEKALRKANETLEQRVKIRTRELRKINIALKNEIIEHRKVENALKESEKQLRAYRDDLEIEVQNRTSELDKTNVELKNSYEKLHNTMYGIILTILKLVEIRDPYTAGHQEKVSYLAEKIARKLNMDEDRITGVKTAAIVHDIGKIYIPSEILTKPGKLSPHEFMFIKMHPSTGYDILKSIDFPWPLAEMVLQHHERIDGSGYPLGLKGDNIMLEAKIIAVADAVEAISSHRPYRPALGIEAAIDEISRYKNTKYDPDVVEACISVVNNKDFSFNDTISF